jgi:hypothetical protein
VYLEGCSEKIDGPNKTVEIDASKFGRRKYHRGHPVKGQWVFGCVERESGRTFLVPVPDRTADTMTNVISAWIEPGTTPISDCWDAYRDIGSLGYTHRTAPQITQSPSSIRTPEIILTPSRIRGVTLRHFLDHATAGRTTNFTSPNTRSRRGARHKGCLCSFPSSRPPPGPPA